MGFEVLIEQVIPAAYVNIISKINCLKFELVHVSNKDHRLDLFHFNIQQHMLFFWGRKRR